MEFKNIEIIIEMSDDMKRYALLSERENSLIKKYENIRIIIMILLNMLIIFPCIKYNVVDLNSWFDTISICSVCAWVNFIINSILLKIYEKIANKNNLHIYNMESQSELLAKILLKKIIDQKVQEMGITRYLIDEICVDLSSSKYTIKMIAEFDNDR